MNESQQVMKEFKGSSALDAGLIASAQAVEHYEYGTLKAWAEQLSSARLGAFSIKPWRKRRRRTRP